MEPLRYTLIADGSSDRCLAPIINWTLRQIDAVREQGFVAQIADLRYLGRPVRELHQRVAEAYAQFPCEVLFVHRDAEGAPVEHRREEIRTATDRAEIPSHVPVIPVRMTESWLLIDEIAIRRAADNPNGTEPVQVPPFSSLEAIDSKDVLDRCLKVASQKKGRRLDQFKRDLPSRRNRVADLIEDFSPLRKLPSFRLFEDAARHTVAELLAAAEPESPR